MWKIQLLELLLGLASTHSLALFNKWWCLGRWVQVCLIFGVEIVLYLLEVDFYNHIQERKVALSLVSETPCRWELEVWNLCAVECWHGEEGLCQQWPVPWTAHAVLFLYLKFPEGLCPGIFHCWSLLRKLRNPKFQGYIFVQCNRVESATQQGIVETNCKCCCTGAFASHSIQKSAKTEVLEHWVHWTKEGVLWTR